MKNIIETLSNQKQSYYPIWMMRQAGRYLPEYLKIRARFDNFLDLCYNSDAACEVTLQPITRFNFDAAIIFADILNISDALGMEVKFVKNEGPRLNNIQNATDINQLNIDNIDQKLSHIYQTISNVKSQLPNHVALIGFAGGVWTVMCYMLASGSKNFVEAKKFINKCPDETDRLVNILTQATIHYLKKQIDHGVDIIQIFDSWSSLLNHQEFIKLSINPTQKIVKALKEYNPNIKIIGFPRGGGANYQPYINDLEIDGISIDYMTSLTEVESYIAQTSKNITTQGNLDPYILAYGSRNQIMSHVESIKQATRNSCHIFNLGHGILPETPISNVEFLLEQVRKL